MIRNPNSSIVANPVLVGAVTALVVIVAVYLSYNANNGLPFVPTTTLEVQVVNGSNLIKGSEVREGGFRVGTVKALEPVMLPDGRVGAQATLQLNQETGRLPVDSRFVIRARGAIGSKYFDIQRGKADRTFDDGATVRASRTSVGVDLDEVLSTFDRRTRSGVRGGLLGFGNGLADRGAELNMTISRLPRLLAYVAPVMGNLASERTDLRGFVAGLERTTGALAPVAGEQARVFTTMADTFEALSRDPRALQDTIAESPPTLTAGTRALARTRPVLRRAVALARELEPASAELRRSLPAINRGVAPLPRALREAEPLAEDTEGALRSLGRLSTAPETGTGLRAVSATIHSLVPQLRFYGPVFTVCKIPQQWLQFVPDVLDVVDPTGLSQRGIVATTDNTQHDDLAVMGANEWATGRGDVQTVPQHHHADNYPFYVDREGNADCLGGQAGYRWGYNPYDTTEDRFYRRAVVEHYPKEQNLGPLWTRFDGNGRPTGQLGPSRVPPGLTFTHEPGGLAPKIP